MSNLLIQELYFGFLRGAEMKIIGNTAYYSNRKGALLVNVFFISPEFSQFVYKYALDRV